jgi:hypothetical protein
MPLSKGCGGAGDFFVRFCNPDFVKLAEYFGAKGYRVFSDDELAPILRNALTEDGPAVIDCRLIIPRISFSRKNLAGLSVDVIYFKKGGVITPPQGDKIPIQI